MRAERDAAVARAAAAEADADRLDDWLGMLVDWIGAPDWKGPQLHRNAAAGMADALAAHRALVADRAKEGNG